MANNVNTKSKQRTTKDVHFRVGRCDFERLCKAATAERRSLANLCEKIVTDWIAGQHSEDAQEANE